MQKLLLKWADRSTASIVVERNDAIPIELLLIDQGGLVDYNRKYDGGIYYGRIWNIKCQDNHKIQIVKVNNIAMCVYLYHLDIE